MKKLLSLSLILPSIILIGCGSGGSDKKGEKHTVEEALKISDVVFNAPRDIDFNNKTHLKLKSTHKRIAKLGIKPKKESGTCDISGTFEIEEDSEGTISAVYYECVDHNEETGLNEYSNGAVTMSADQEYFTFFNYSEIPDYSNFGTGTYYKDVKIHIHSEKNLDEMKIDGTIDEYQNGAIVETITATNLIMRNKSLEKAWYFNGGLYYKSGCFSQTHVYKTDDKSWLIENSQNDNYWSSGILYVDNAKYVYSGDEVTVTKEGKTGTFKQQALIDELNREKSSTDCNVTP